MTNQHPKEEARIRKVYAIESKAATLNENQIEGAAAAIGNMDRGGDVIFPGAFKKALPAFLKEGFTTTDHDWTFEDICAMPISAKEVGNQLVCVAEFHSDDDSQAVRTKCRERMEKGLSVGLSIGFCCDYTDENSRMWFENGKAMWKYIEDTKVDQTPFDKKSITGWGEWCRAIFNVAELYEYSIVAVPMNQKATATSVKSVSTDESDLNALSFEDHSESVLTAVKGYVNRAADYKALRDSKSRPLSEARREEFEAIRDELDALLKTSEPTQDDDASLIARARHEEWLAKQMNLIA